MTSKTVPRTCDFCAKDITSEKKYRAQISERTAKGDYPEATIVKCKNDADMCHGCFLEICKNGYEPKWIHIVKNDEGYEPSWLDIDVRTAQRADRKRNETEQQTLTAGTTTLITGSTT